jgi:hypothetical protein
MTDGQRRVLWELKDAHDQARQVDSDVTAFAVSLEVLCSGGVSQADVRFLLKIGLAELVERIESRRAGKPGGYRRGVDVPFSAASFLLPTPAGVERMRRLRSEARHNNRARHAPQPRWDEIDYTLYVGAARVWHFAQPALQQVTLVRAFEAHAWANPLSLDKLSQDRLQLAQLQTAVRNLNRNARPHLRFRLQRGSRHVYWQYYHEPRRYPNATQEIAQGEA